MNLGHSDLIFTIRLPILAIVAVAAVTVAILAWIILKATKK